MNLDRRPQPRDQVVVQRASGSLVLLDLEAGTYFALDEVGDRVWELCDGTRSIADVVARVVEEFDADAAVIQADVVALIVELEDEKLLVAGP